MRRIFTVDATGRDERVFVARQVGDGAICPSAILSLEAVIRTSAYRGGFDQRTNGRLSHHKEV